MCVCTGLVENTVRFGLLNAVEISCEFEKNICHLLPTLVSLHSRVSDVEKCVKQRRKLQIQTSYAKETQKMCAGSCCYAERFIFLSTDRRNYENILIKFLYGLCISVSCE